MITISPKDIGTFQQEILGWYANNKRNLPWRQTRDPYKILVSEVMLQQTQVSRVIEKYKQWLEKFPTVIGLANAKPADILALWSGLGYNRRALYLQKAAQTVVDQYDGQFPKTTTELKSLPGLGEYTARAVACFAFDQQIAVVDTNVRKIISLRFFNGVPPDAKTLQQVADQLLPHGHAYQWNQALMDYCSATLSKHKVPTPKQSKFTGSNRYYRGQTIKLLVQHEQISIDELAKLLKPDFSETDRPWLTKLIDGLVRDHLVETTDGIVRLPT